MWESCLSGSVRGWGTTEVWPRYCGTTGKLGGKPRTPTSACSNGSPQSTRQEKTPTIKCRRFLHFRNLKHRHRCRFESCPQRAPVSRPVQRVLTAAPASTTATGCRLRLFAVSLHHCFPPSAFDLAPRKRFSNSRLGAEGKQNSKVFDGAKNRQRGDPPPLVRVDLPL